MSSHRGLETSARNMSAPSRHAARVGRFAQICVLFFFALLLTPLGFKGRAFSSQTNHYEYVFPDGNMYVYDMDNSFSLVKHITIPVAKGIRGVAVGVSTHMLYISYGGDGGPNGNGSMLEFDLLSDSIVWEQNYSTGIDSMAITPDAKTIYLPTGELTSGSTWDIVDAATGNVTGGISAGSGPHNTLVSLDGKNVYMDGRNSNFLWEAGTSNNTVSQKMGPLKSTCRPFTINGKQTLAFTTSTGFLGFQVENIQTGAVLYTVPVSGFSCGSCQSPSAPSHGVSLSPNEKEVYLMDAPNSFVHVFDVTGLPNSAPLQVADIQLRSMAGSESGCLYDCLRDGWVRHSLDGRFVMVGDSGDIIDTAQRKSIINLDTLYNTRKFIEVDWQNGVPVATSTRHGMGYVTSSVAPPTNVSVTVH